MRVSCEKDDPGYKYWLKNKQCRIFLNDIEVDSCIMADSDEGVIKRFVKDEIGNFVADGDGIKTEILKGKVEIR